MNQRRRIAQSFWSCWLPPLSIALLIVLVSYKFVFLGMTPINSDWLVNTFEPWKSALGREQIPYEYNNDTDPVIYMYPLKYMTVHLMKDGVLPLWNPYILAGTPLWGNNFATPLNPLNFILFLFPFDKAWGLFLVLQLAVAGFSTYAYMRELEIDRWGSALSAYAYSLNGTFVVWLQNVSFVGVYAWVPLFLWLCERAVRRNSLPLAVVLGYVLAVYFFSGMIQIAAYSLLFSVVYLGMRLAQSVHDKRMTAQGALALAGIVLGVGAVVSIPQLYLEKEVIQSTSRSVTHYAGGNFLHPPMLLSFVSPYFFGLDSNGTEVGNTIFYRGLLRLNPPYVGIVTLILAVIGWFNIKGGLRYFYSLFSVILVAVFLALAVQPIYRLVLGLVPLFDSVDHYRIMGLYTLSVSVLAGFGFHALLTHSLNRRAQTGILAGFGLLAAVVLGGMEFLSLTDSQSMLAAIKGLFSPLIGGSHGMTGMARFLEYLQSLNQSYGSILLSEQVSTPAAMLAAGLGIISLWGSRPRWCGFLKYVIVGMVGVDLVGHALVYPAYSRTVYPETGAIRFLKNQKGNFRILGISDRQEFPVGDMLPPSTNLLYGLYDIRGYENLHPRWYYEIMTGKDQGTSIEKLNEVPKSWLDFLNVRFVMTGRRLESPEYRLVYDREVRIYENRGYAPRVRFSTRAEFYNTEDEVLQRVRQADFDPRSVVALQGSNPAGANGVGTQDEVRKDDSPNATVRLITYKANELEATVETDRPGWLILSESYFPGWAAWVNNVPKPVLRANYAFRAVPVDKGYSRVVLRYRPRFRYLVLFTIVVIPVLAWFLMKVHERRRRRSPRLDSTLAERVDVRQ